ncbi:transcription termination/antitermination protein NusG [Bradyrhizobium sp. Pha-3]|uniref:transcription termination/antitermination protein NusG n=1 Tax=Bradyrhizobium sp. Pha-3 TaxID=208375 RepID=UPI0035D5179E
MNMVVEFGNLENVRQALKVGQIVEYLSPQEAISVPLPKRWYILRTMPTREFQVIRRFARLGLSAYLPTLTARREFRRYKAGYEWIERRNVTMPLIAGAMLVPDFEIDAGHWKSVEGVFGILRFGDFVPTISPALLADLRRIEAIGNTPKSKRDHYFKIGQLVRVLSGPFRDFCGRVERFDNTGRINVGLEIFSRITPSEFDEGEIEAV